MFLCTCGEADGWERPLQGAHFGTFPLSSPSLHTFTSRRPSFSFIPTLRRVRGRCLDRWGWKKKRKVSVLEARFTSVPLSPSSKANGLVQCADFCRKLPESVCVFECVCRGKWRDTPSGFFLTRVHHLLELLGFLCIVYDCVCVCLSDRDLDLAPWKRQHFSTLFHYGRNTHSRLIIHAGYRHLSHSFRWRDTTNDKKQGWKGVWEGRDAAVPLTKTADTSDPREKKKRGHLCGLI